MRQLVVSSLLVLTIALMGCGQPAATGAGPSGSITVAGSTTVQPLAEKLSEVFGVENPAVAIDVQGGGSSVGIKSAGEGTVDIGTASREVQESEKQEYPNMKVHVIARDGIALIAHPDVVVDDLTKEQVRGIFAGEVTNWSEVGGADRPIIVVAREEGSGTRAAFEEMVMGDETPILAGAILQPSNGAVRTTVSTTPDAIGFVSFGYVDQSVKVLQVEGAAPTEANASDGSYPIVRPLNMLTNGEPTGAVKAWLDWILSEAGQQVVAGEGYIRVE